MLTIFLATTFGPLQRVLDTVELSVEQWAICIVCGRPDHRRGGGPQGLPSSSELDRGGDRQQCAAARDRLMSGTSAATSR